jgi:Zn-dependent protease with chaperone function
VSDISERLQAMGILGRRIPPMCISARFRLALACGGLLAILFPLAYFGLITLTGWGAYCLAAGHAPVMSCIALVSGGLLILSLLKPLVAKSIPSPKPHALDPEKESLLFAFVREIAAAGGMPAPSRIAVDCNVNCYCAFVGGITGLFRSGFDLILGLPLVASLRLDQFGGVVAHELGHAAQTTNMRSSQSIWGVSAWLSQVSFQRDTIDEALLTWLSTSGQGRRLAVRVAQLLILPGREVLRLLRIAEKAATSAFLRRMELEADRCQVRVAGTAGFISTVLELNLLSVAAQRAVVELSRMRLERQLAADYPGMIASIRRSYSLDFVQNLPAGVEKRGTHVLSAHPGDKDRITLARAEASPGIVTADFPASVLFANFEPLCREVTREFYQQELGLTLEGYELVLAPHSSPRS